MLGTALIEQPCRGVTLTVTRRVRGLYVFCHDFEHWTLSCIQNVVRHMNVCSRSPERHRSTTMPNHGPSNNWIGWASVPLLASPKKTWPIKSYIYLFLLPVKTKIAILPPLYPCSSQFHTDIMDSRCQCCSRLFSFTFLFSHVTQDTIVFWWRHVLTARRIALHAVL